jgi:hypothetical protein
MRGRHTLPRFPDADYSDRHNPGDTDMGRGIDYGMGSANIDRATGIRFGVIPMNSLNEWAWESFEADYGDPTCGECGGSVVDYDDDLHGEYKHGRGCSDLACEPCERVYETGDCYGEEPIGHTCTDSDYSATVDSYNDVFITRAPYFTRAAYCSPCAPGACHLGNPCDDGDRAYCFGHDWFEGGRAPYPVYSVETGEIVEPG